MVSFIHDDYILTVVSHLTFWKACFDFARIVGLVIDDIVPYQPLIQSISTILSEDKQGLPVFRYVFN